MAVLDEPATVKVTNEIVSRDFLLLPYSNLSFPEGKTPPYFPAVLGEET